MTKTEKDKYIHLMAEKFGIWWGYSEIEEIIKALKEIIADKTLIAEIKRLEV